VVIDSSALLAVLMMEPEAVPFADAIERDPIRLVSTLSALEASTVIGSRRGPAGVGDLDLLLYRIGAELVAFNREQFEIARSAYSRFGKGKHPAALNLGDCCSYALAVASGEPLLAKGNDFPRTDARLVSSSNSA
jgi:ribonuclease VapC